jgi:hypothetical protein
VAAAEVAMAAEAMAVERAEVVIEEAAPPLIEVEAEDPAPGEAAQAIDSVAVPALEMESLSITWVEPL